MLGGTEIAVLVGAAVLLFGADKVPKLARSMGQVKKEYLVGQAEADVEAERLRAEARTAADRNAAARPAETAVPLSPSVTIPASHGDAASASHGDATAPLPPIPPQPPQSAPL